MMYKAIIKTNQLMMYKAKTAVCAEIRTKKKLNAKRTPCRIFLILTLVLRK